MPLHKIIFRGNLGYAFTAVFNYIDVLKSIDYGETWTTISYSVPLPDFGSFQILDSYINSSGDFIGTTDG